MAYSVGFVTKYISSLLEGDLRLKNIEIEGEISNITYHKSGMIFFTLKDAEAIMPCSMYKSDAARLSGTKPKMGDKITAKGRISVYAPHGKYQFSVSSIKLSGEGELYARFLELKNELEEKGMFDEVYKRPIPKYIKTLGVVTSPTGAAVRDIINITKQRNPYVSVILYPALVQGDGAAYSVAEGIATLDNMGVDVMIVGRGGGSIEDLWAFNEEVVADAIFSCNTPIISAVGHETDFTIADFVSDLRAPTPTAGAVYAVYDVMSLKNSLLDSANTLNTLMKHNIESKRQKSLMLRRHLLSLSPKQQILTKKNAAKNIGERMNSLIQSKIDRARSHLQKDAASLDALSPARRLSQGYSYVTNSKNENVYKKEDVSVGENLNIRVTDGLINATVTEVN